MRILLSFFLLSTWLADLSHSDSGFSFRSTLSDDVQEKLAHCDSIQGPQKLLCEILGALDAQGQNTPNPEPNKAQNPSPQCRFKSEGGHKLHRYASAPSPQLQAIMESYNSMHRRCTALELHNITNIYNSHEIPRCKYVIWGAGHYGLGNRLISFISAFLYALLSQRVMLIDYPEWNQLFCYPFEGSPLQVPHEPPMKPDLGVSFLGLRIPSCRIQEGKAESPRSNTTILNMLLYHYTKVEELEFLVCPKGISRARNVPFVNMKDSNQYYAPGFFLNPALSPVLDMLFPERNPFHVLSKYLFSPSDQVWDRIRLYADDIFLKSRRRIGAQIREFKHGYTDAFDPNVLLCIRRKAGFLPIQLRKPNRISSDDYFSVYVATLAQGHITKLNESLKAVKKETGKRFRVSWQQLDGIEKYDGSHQQQALIDMWMLSLSDVLVASPMSTFGYMARGLGGVVPYFIHPDPDVVCEAGMGSDPCYQFAPNKLMCEEDSIKLSAKELLNQSRAVKPCHDMPETGWELVLPF